MLPRAILFDLDDTLADRRAGLRRYAARFATDLADRLTDPAEEAAHRAILAADDFGSTTQAERLCAAPIWREAPLALELHDHWRDCFGACAMPFDGALTLLTELRERGISLGLVTNDATAMQRAKIAALGIEPLLNAILISAEVGLRKPDPAIFALALDQLGCAPDESWFVGDHPEHDVRGAYKVGLRAFWVRTGAVVGEDVPGTHLRTLTELLTHLQTSAQ